VNYLTHGATINGLMLTSRNEQGSGPLIRTHVSARAILPPFGIDIRRVIKSEPEVLTMRLGR